MTSLAAVVLVCIPLPEDHLPVELEVSRLFGDSSGLVWHACPGSSITIVGQEVRFEKKQRSVRILEGDRSVATLSKLPSAATVTRKQGGRTLKYSFLLREVAPEHLEVASCMGIVVESAAGQSLLLDADLDGVFLESDGDALLLYDTCKAVAFTGSVWHSDQSWTISDSGEMITGIKGSDNPGAAALAFLNHNRQLAGLQPVTLDADRSEGATLHADYIAHNWGQTFNHHTQDSANPWYSAKGAASAQQSLFGYPPIGDEQPLATAIAANLDIVYHRRSVLKRGLESVGIGMQPQLTPAVDGGFRIVCIDVGGATKPKNSGFVLWPAEGQVETPTHFNGREQPLPLPPGLDAKNRGYPVTMIFDAYDAVQNATLELSQLDSKLRASPVAGYSFGPGHEIDSSDSIYSYAYEHNSYICHFIAEHPLKSNTWYEAVCRWQTGGEDLEQRWRFRTGQESSTSLR